MKFQRTFITFKIKNRSFAKRALEKKTFEISEKWKETNAALKNLTTTESDLRAQLIALSKEKSAKGNNLTLSKSVCKGNVDYLKAFEEYVDNLRAHYPDIQFPGLVTEPYRKKSFTKWTIRGT